ncbi:MAG: glycosyltransferase family 39 protein [Planctomycetes bacterium]|nr:glycosyltransferase family 39 protein [Planctomycetota bacterium]
MIHSTSIRAPDRNPTRWSNTVIPVGIVLSAIAMRAGFLWGSPDRAWPPSALYEGDAPLWVQFARSIHDGTSFEMGIPLHAPGMAWLLRWIAPIGNGATFLSTKLLMSGLGCVNCLIAALLARRVAGTTVGAICGVLCAASFGLTVQSTTLNNETPYAFLLLLSLLMLRRTGRPRAGRAALWGAVNALAALLRPEHALIFSLLVLYSLSRGESSSSHPAPRRGVGLALLSAAVFVLIPLPMSYRSYHAIKQFNTVEPTPVDFASLGIRWTDDARETIAGFPAFAREPNARLLSALARQRGLSDVTQPFIEKWLTEEVQYTPQPLSAITFLSSQGPLAFALANNADADGGFSTRLLDTVMGAPAPDGAVSVNDFSFANPCHLRLYQHGYFAGLQYIYLNPVAAMSLVGRKLANFMSGIASGLTLWNLPTGVIGVRRPVDQLAANLGEVKVWSLLLLALTMVGVFTALSRRVGGTLLVVIGGKLLITCAFFGYARQGVATLPLVYVFFAMGFERLFISPFVQPGAALEHLGRRIFLGACAVVIVSSLWLGGRGWSYDISGRADPAPQWGVAAFESHQPLRIDIIR